MINQDIIKQLGGLPDAKIETNNYSDGSFDIRAYHPKYESFLTIHPDKTMRYGSLVTSSKVRHSRTLLDVLRNQLEGAKQLGIHTISTLAHRDDKSGHFGHSVWPKLNFNGILTSVHKANLPKEYHEAPDIKTLYSMPGGKEVWEKHGQDIELSGKLEDIEKALKEKYRMSLNNLRHALHIGLKYKCSLSKNPLETRLESEDFDPETQKLVHKTVRSVLDREPLIEKAFKWTKPILVFRGKEPWFNFLNVKHSPDTNEIHIRHHDDPNVIKKQTTDALARSAWHTIHDYLRNGEKELIKQVPHLRREAPLESNEIRNVALDRFKTKYTKLRQMQNALRMFKEAVFNEPDGHYRIGENKFNKEKKKHLKGQDSYLVNKILVAHLKQLLNKPGKYLPSKIYLKELEENSRTPGTTQAFSKLYHILMKNLP